MKSMKQILSAFLLSGALLASGSVLAETAKSEPVKAEQAMPAKSAVENTDKVNVNTATADELKRMLVGIGQKKAEAIVQYREKHGAFTSAEQLLEVQGFGKATLEKNKDRILL